MERLCLYLFILIIYITRTLSFDKMITINIDPGREDCFFQYIKEGETIALDYQVIDGGHGDLDITFSASDPDGRILYNDIKKSENDHEMAAPQSGDYKFCFDNTFSSYNTKTVFFQLFVENDDYWGNNENINFNLPEGVSAEEVYDLKVQDIAEIIDRVRLHLAKVRHYQDLLKSFEARDRNIAEENYFKVNSFSFLQGAIMIVVGIIQVIMVRSLFDDRSKVHKIWKHLDLKN